jgi:sulfur carrier protein
MNIVINGRPSETAAETVVADVVARLSKTGAGVAVAVNGDVVPRGEWATTGLKEGEVLTAVQGG